MSSPDRSQAQNPLLAELEAATSAAAFDEEAREAAIRRYGFAVPNDAALDEISGHALPRGVVEIGAGTGYWAAALSRKGVDVVAYDLEPAPSAENQWFAGTEPWFTIGRADHTVVRDHTDRLLLVVWPTRNETWAADAVEAYAIAGGRRVAYIGEGPGGRTGDDRFHALLGEIPRCIQCIYGVSLTTCTCGIRPRWQRVATVELPRWPGCEDRLYLYGPNAPRDWRLAKKPYTMRATIRRWWERQRR